MPLPAGFKAAFADLGNLVLKNIERPVRVCVQMGSRGLEGLCQSLRRAAPSMPTTTTAPNVPLALPDKPSIAVLPFENMSGDPEQEYFVDGIAEDIITELSRFRSLFVIARNS